MVEVLGQMLLEMACPAEVLRRLVEVVGHVEIGRRMTATQQGWMRPENQVRSSTGLEAGVQV